MSASGIRPKATEHELGPAPTQPVVEASALSKIYGSGSSSKLAVADVSFTVSQGEFVSIVGPSGAGKTTLLKCLTGLSPRSGGSARFDGVDVTEPPPKMAIVFQDYGRSLFPWMTVAGNVELPLRGKGIPRADRAARIARALEAVALPDVGRQYPWQLSGGMQQRVALARSLAYEPDCLVMDEPFASVDAQTRFDLEDLILRIQAELGVTVVFVTHDIDEAVYLSDRVVVLTESPARVRRMLGIDLGKPRDQLTTRRDPRFAELRTTLLELVRRPDERSQGQS
jgi:NitT/TauT family transport system ATP-binding protein